MPARIRDSIPEDLQNDPQVVDSQSSDAMSSDDASTDASSSEGEGEETDNGQDEEDDPLRTDGDLAVEKGIEGDFERLLQEVRSSDTSAAAGVLSDKWDFTNRDDDQFHTDIRAASGIGRSRARGKGRRRQGPPLSHQVQSLIGDATQAYVVSNDIPLAISLCTEILRIEPRAIDPWIVLANCYDDLNEKERGLQLRIMAAHLRHDKDEWENLAHQSSDMGLGDQALYCYGKLVRLDPGDMTAWWERAGVARSVGDLKTAKQSFLAILHRFPHDISVLNELHTILIELNDLQLCAELFQAAFDHYLATFPSDPPVPSAPKPGHSLTPDSSKQPFGSMDILILADLHNSLSEHGKAVEVIKRGTRWLQGRASQTYWEGVVDDREYDFPGLETERIGNPRPGRYPLDINARHRLAIARIKLRDEEGKLHAQVILAQDPLDYAPLFLELADTYFGVDMYAEAHPIYEILGTHPATSSIYVLMQTATCLKMSGEMAEAADVFEHILSADSENNEAKMELAGIYEALNNPRRALDLVYEVIDSRKRQRTERDTSTAAPPALKPGSLFAENAFQYRTSTKKSNSSKRLTPAALAKLEAEKEAEVVQGYQRLLELWPMLAYHDKLDIQKEWIDVGGRIVDIFRETRLLFSSSGKQPVFRGMTPRRPGGRKTKGRERQEEEELRFAERLVLDLERNHAEVPAVPKSTGNGSVQIYRGVHFDDWMKVFIQYAFLLTSHGYYDQAEDMIRHVSTSVPYQSSISAKLRFRLTLLTISITSSPQHPAHTLEHARTLVRDYQFNNEAIRIFCAVLSPNLSEMFINDSMRKFLFREMRLGDLAVRDSSSLKFHRRWGAGKNEAGVLGKGKKTSKVVGEEDLEGEDVDGSGAGDTTVEKGERTPLPTKKNPAPLALYGQMALSAKSYQTALFYLLQAYDILPQDPLICLSLAVASLGRAMQRQADNRHHLVVQGFAFFTKYKTYRIRDSRKRAETEFNLGRMYHQLGLLSHAARHYERVLAVFPSQEKGELDLTKEAAYNLSLIFMMTGASSKVEDLYRKWLSI